MDKLFLEYRLAASESIRRILKRPVKYAMNDRAIHLLLLLVNRLGMTITDGIYLRRGSKGDDRRHRYLRLRED